MITPEFKASASLNLMNFMFYGGISCIAPFLSVHMRALGLTLWHMVWVHVASGLVSILVPLLIGSIAERKSSTPRRYLYKLCFSVALMIATFGYTALLAVPRVQRLPRQPLIDFDCSSPINAVINLEKCGNWETCSDVAAAWSSKTYFRLSHCRYKSKHSDDAQPYAPNSPNPLHLCFRSVTNTTNLCLIYDPHFRENSIMEFISDLSSWQYTEYINVSAKEFSFSDLNVAPSSLSVCNFVPANTGTVIKVHNRTHDSVFCRRSPTEDVLGIKCLLSLHSEGKKPICYDVVGDLSFTFWIYLGLRSAADGFFITALCLLEGITLRTIQAGPYHRGVYGRTRMWPSAAFIIFPIVIGVLVDYFTDVAGVADYSPAFFISAAFELTTCFLIFVLPLHVGGNTFRYEVSADPSGRNYTEEISQKYKVTLEMVVVSIISIFAGIAWGVAQVFDPLLYQDFGFNHLLLGSTVSMGFLCGLPFLLVSKNLIQNIGEAHLISAAFAFHSIHLAGLSFVKDWTHWWWATPFEAMKSFTIPIMWITLVATVEHDNTSKGKKIVMHYVLAILHFATGRMAGSSFAGLMGEYFSMSLSYRVVSAFCLFISVIYLILHHCCMKPRHRRMLAKRSALHRQSLNGSCLLLVERVPVNGMIVPHRSNS